MDTIRKQIRKEKTSPVSSQKRLNMVFGEKTHNPKRQNNPPSHKSVKYNIDIQPKYNQLNTEKMEVILPIRDDNDTKKNNGNNANKRTITRPNPKIETSVKGGINKKHPNFFSPEASEILESDKHIIIGEIGCGICENQKKITDGKYVTLEVDVTGKTNKDGELIGVKIDKNSTWDNFKNTFAVNEQSFNKLSQVEQGLAKKLPNVQKELSQIEEQKSQIKDRKKRSEMEKREKQLRTFVKDYNEVSKVKKQVEHLYLMNKALVDPKIDYENTMKRYKIVYTNSDDKREKKGASEISDMYDQEGYPMTVLDRCAIDKKDPKELAKCKIEGMKSPMQLVILDAQQRGDMDKVEYVKELQKKLREM